MRILIDKKAYVEIKTVVRVTETDSYRIAHHSNYAVWAEMALRKLIIERKGQVPKYNVISFDCKYKASAQLDDELLIRLWLKNKPSEKEYVFRFDMHTERVNKVLAVGELCVRMNL